MHCPSLCHLSHPVRLLAFEHQSSVVLVGKLKVLEVRDFLRWMTAFEVMAVEL